MKSLIFIGLLTCSSVGCQTFADVAKSVALEVIEKEKPKIQAAMVGLKDSAVREAKTMILEASTSLQEKSATVLEAKAREWNDKAQLLAGKPDKSLAEQMEMLKYLFGGGAAAQVLQLLLTGASEKRKKERDFKAEVAAKV